MKVAKKLYGELCIAVSGGVDSMTALHYVSRNHKVSALHYIHNSEYAEQEYNFVKEYCKTHEFPLTVEVQPISSHVGLSKEEYWRKGRYEFFNKSNLPVIVGTTLDDAVEWYLFSSAHGLGKYMEYQHGKVIRPFLLTKKDELIDYATKNNIPWLEDHSNQDVNYAARNRIRHNILPEMLKINPGLYTVVKKRCKEKLLEKGY